MSRKLLILYACLLCFCINLKGAPLDSLLNVLDKTIEERKTFNRKKEAIIDGLRVQYDKSASKDQQFHVLGKLFSEYDNYQTDSAYKIVEARFDLARKLDSVQKWAVVYMNLADVYRTTGLYKEALETLEYIKSNNWQVVDKAYYYHLYHSLYVLMSDYAVLEKDKQRYHKLVLDYKDSLLVVLDKNDLSYPLVESTKYMMYGEFNKALEVLSLAESKFGDNSPMLNYTLSEVYGHIGNIEKQKYCLALSAIEDLRSSIKEYISLHKLADILYSEGDLNRAYFYMKCALDDAVFSNSRLRTLQVSQMLPLVADAHDHKTIREKRAMLIALSVIGLLALVLFIALSYIYKQLKQLSKIKEAQKKLNGELTEINRELNIVNKQLGEANHVKVEYISYLFNMCSTYISKMEDFRLLVKRNIQTNQVKQLAKTVSTSSLVSDELKEFYRNFDAIFLKIYPTFVEDFNKLLTEEGKVNIKEGELLTPELRIYALIRLGITDSAKIADFLHYSTQTIYNYRQKVRNKAKSDRDEFLDEISRIGLD